MFRKEIVAACQIHLSVQLYYLGYIGVSRLKSVAILSYKPLKSIYYVPTYLVGFTEKSDLTLQWTILNTSSHKHIWKFDSQHVCVHAWHVVGFCSAIFTHVHVMDVQMCVFFFGFGYILRKCMGGYMISVLCFVYCAPLSNCMYECVSTTVCLIVYKLGSPCTNIYIDVLDGGGEHTSLRHGACDGCARPGTAPHARQIVILELISLAKEPLILHIIMLWWLSCEASVFCRHASICSSTGIDVYVCLSVPMCTLRTAVTSMEMHARVFCHRVNWPQRLELLFYSLSNG